MRELNASASNLISFEMKQQIIWLAPWWALSAISCLCYIDDGSGTILTHVTYQCDLLRLLVPIG